MSWGTINSTPIERKDIWTVDVTPQPNPEGVEPAALEQINAAREAANALAYAMGGEDDLVTISLSGHANPGHANPFPGWGDEFITVSVRVARKL